MGVQMGMKTATPIGSHTGSRTVAPKKGTRKMISKSVIVFWSVACLTIFVHLMGRDGGGTAYYILFTGLIWAIVVIPTALIANVFKSRKVYSPKMQMIRGGVLTAIGLLTFMVVHSSQRPTAPAASQQHTRSDYFWSDKAGGPGVFVPNAQPTGRGFQPWVER